MMVLLSLITLVSAEKLDPSEDYGVKARSEAESAYQAKVSGIREAAIWAGKAELHQRTTPAKLYEKHVVALGGTYIPPGVNGCKEETGCAEGGRFGRAGAFLGFERADQLMQYQAAAEETKRTVEKTIKEEAAARGVSLTNYEMKRVLDEAIDEYAPSSALVLGIYALETVGVAVSMAVGAGELKAAGYLANAAKVIETSVKSSKLVKAGVATGEMVLANTADISLSTGDFAVGEGGRGAGTLVGVVLGDGVLGNAIKGGSHFLKVAKSAKTLAKEIEEKVISEAVESGTEVAAKETIQIGAEEVSAIAAETAGETLSTTLVQKTQSPIETFLDKAYVALKPTLTWSFLGEEVGAAGARLGKVVAKESARLGTIKGSAGLVKEETILLSKGQDESSSPESDIGPLDLSETGVDPTFSPRTEQKSQNNEENNPLDCKKYQKIPSAY
ncbi:MAG: hypothetical protein V2A62_02630 [Candidatus Woesearchaeota archaeon]